MADFDYETWANTVRESLASLVDVFETRYGYPPDRNVVEVASGGISTDQASVLPESLGKLYTHFAELSLPDVHVGYFVHPLAKTLAGLDGSLPTEVRGIETFSIVTFGSDGGGSLFAVKSPEGAPVYLLPPGEVRDGVYIDNESRARVVASTVPEFLKRLGGMIESYLIQDYRPSSYLS
jgi:hypothetical protein